LPPPDTEQRARRPAFHRRARWYRASSAGFTRAILLWGEQLSPVSNTRRGLPGDPSVHHRVENRQQLAHAGYQGDFPRLTGGAEALEKCADHGIAADRSQRGHVQRRANRGPSAPDVARATLLATVPVQRRDAHQGGDPAAIELPEFGQVGQERRRQDWTDPGMKKHIFTSVQVEERVERVSATRLTSLAIHQMTFRLSRKTQPDSNFFSRMTHNLLLQQKDSVAVKLKQSSMSLLFLRSTHASHYCGDGVYQDLQWCIGKPRIFDNGSK